MPRTILLAAVLLLSCFTIAHAQVITVDIVVWDGELGDESFVIAACTSTCLGYNLTPTGTVTHLRNTVGYGMSSTASCALHGDPKKVVYLYVDGKKIDASRLWPMTWNTRDDMAGPHTIQARAIDCAGNEAWSAPLVVTVIK